MSKGGSKPLASQAEPEKSIPPQQDDLTRDRYTSLVLDVHVEHEIDIIESAVMTILPA